MNTAFVVPSKRGLIHPTYSAPSLLGYVRARDGNVRNKNSGLKVNTIFGLGGGAGGHSSGKYL